MKPSVHGNSDPSAFDADRPVVVVVHGVGRQIELQTLQSFIEGTTAGHDFPSSDTRAQLAYKLRSQGAVDVEGVPCAFTEFNYARSISRHLRYAEQDPRTWIRSLRNRLKEINRRRGGPADLPFTPSGKRHRRRAVRHDPGAVDRRAPAPQRG